MFVSVCVLNGFVVTPLTPSFSDASGEVRPRVCPLGILYPSSGCHFLLVTFSEARLKSGCVSILHEVAGICTFNAGGR